MNSFESLVTKISVLDTLVITLMIMLVLALLGLCIAPLLESILSLPWLIPTLSYIIEVIFALLITGLVVTTFSR